LRCLEKQAINKLPGKMLQSKIHPNLIEVGCDEAGRGCLAGPVVAAAVILPNDFHHPWLNDSKQVGKSHRNALRDVIEKEALFWAVGVCSHEEIDQINILNASILAMHRAIKKLGTIPEFIAVDGNRFKPYPNIPHQTEVKGDGRFLHIAAASILAKTHRDEIMERLHQEFPHYGWNQNAGYPTLAHRNAIRTHGITPHHRKSFRLLPEQLRLF
jgi:ribonuclease HII